MFPRAIEHGDNEMTELAQWSAHSAFIYVPDGFRIEVASSRDSRIGTPSV